MSTLTSEDWDPFAPKKKKVNLRAKGQNFERRMCKLLSEWTGKSFTRVPNSGGIKTKDKADYKGDITADDIPFVIECKSVTGGSIVTGPAEARRLDFNMKSAMIQAMGDAYNVGKIPIVMRNHERKVVVAIPVVPSMGLDLCEKFQVVAGPPLAYYDAHKVLQETRSYVVINDFVKYTKEVKAEELWVDIASMFPYLTSAPDTFQH